jgi:hypothetical protein
MLFDSKNEFRTSNANGYYGPTPEEDVNYSGDSFIKPHEIDNSAAIFSAQKIREVNYKYRKRKIDQEIDGKESDCRLFILLLVTNEDEEEGANRKPQSEEISNKVLPSQRPIQYEKYISYNNENMMSSNASIMKKENIDARYNGSSMNQNLMKSNMHISRVQDSINTIDEPQLADPPKEALFVK